MKVIFAVILLLAVLAVCFGYCKYLKVKKYKNTKKYFNIVLIGAAGSGKGTQSEMIKKEMNLLPISAGEVLRQYRKNPNAKYTKVINEYIDQGQLVPSKITHKIMGKYIKENVFCDNCQYNGIIFDGFPRQIQQLQFLDKFLRKYNNKVDAVVHIDVPVDELVDRLSGRFSCATCGELYHKKTKPTKVEGVCDKCGGTHFNVRADDQDKEAIRLRFRIFNETTVVVLNEYIKRGIVIKVDGAKKPDEISKDILTEIKKIQQK